MSAKRVTASAGKRTTSTRKVRLPGQPASRSQLVSLTGGDRPPQRQDGWTAAVARVERCSSVEYDGGKGFKQLWEYSATEPHKRCFLEASGDLRGLTLLLEMHAVRNDPSPTVYRFNIAEDENQYTIRIFDYKICMELHVNPERGGRGRAKPVGDYFAIFFRAEADSDIIRAKAMMRRVENITLEMPDKWFKYRNYFTKPSILAGSTADDDSQSGSQGSVTAGAYEKELSGGYKVRWTGALATPTFLRAMGHLNINPARQQSEDDDEGLADARNTRTNARKASLRGRAAFKHSTLPLRTQVVERPATRKEKQAAKKAKKEERRRAQRAALLDSEPDDGDNGGLGSSPAGEVVNSPQSSDDQDQGETRYPIKAVTDDEVQNGTLMFLVEWEGDYENSWQPRENIDDSAIVDYYQKKAEEATKKPVKRKRGRPRKPKPS